MSERFFRNIIVCWLIVLLLFLIIRVSFACNWVNTVDGHRVCIPPGAHHSIWMNCSPSFSGQQAQSCSNYLNSHSSGFYIMCETAESIPLIAKGACIAGERVVRIIKGNPYHVFFYYLNDEDYSYSFENSFKGDTCPNSAVYCHVGGKKCQERNCSIAVWQDANGRCGNVVTTQCSAEDIQYCDENNLWITEVRSCISVNGPDELKDAMQDIWTSKCCYSYTDWSNRDEIKNMKYYMVDNYDPNKDKQVPNVDYNATGNSTVVVSPFNGVTGNANVENATTSDLADYLAAIQANTAAIAANLEKLNLTAGMGSGSGSNGLYIGSGSGSGSGVNGSGSGSGNMTIDWGEGEVEALTQEDFNTDIDVPGDIEAMGNATYGQGVTDVIENLPIITALRSSGVEIQNSQCSITGTIYGHTINIDFCNDVITNLLTVMGTVIYGVAIFYFFFIVFTF